MNCTCSGDLCGVAVLHTLPVLLCRVNDVLGNIRFSLDYLIYIYIYIYIISWDQVFFPIARLSTARSLFYLFMKESFLPRTGEFILHIYPA